jgi:hypothetical protein
MQPFATFVVPECLRRLSSFTLEELQERVAQLRDMAAPLEREIGRRHRAQANAKPRYVVPSRFDIESQPIPLSGPLPSIPEVSLSQLRKIARTLREQGLDLNGINLVVEIDHPVQVENMPGFVWADMYGTAAWSAIDGEVGKCEQWRIVARDPRQFAECYGHTVIGYERQAA